MVLTAPSEKIPRIIPITRPHRLTHATGRVLGRITLEGLLLGCMLWSIAQAQPPKPPDLPVINPANTKVLVTSIDLGNPIAAIGFAGEDGQLRLWTHQEGKELVTADGKPAIVRAHPGVITASAPAPCTASQSAPAGRWDGFSWASTRLCPFSVDDRAPHPP